jgi:hypothetical protein
VKPNLKAIVLRTPHLKETLAFFVGQLGFIIKESSPTHFVIHSKGIRILFVKSNSGMEVELYLTQRSAHEILIQEDPNQIKIIIS